MRTSEMGMRVPIYLMFRIQCCSRFSGTAKMGRAFVVFIFLRRKMATWRVHEIRFIGVYLDFRLMNISSMPCEF
jgi:hypothetical protein